MTLRTCHTERIEDDQKEDHGRIDSRIYIQFEVPKTFTRTSRWKNLKTIVVVVYKCVVQGEHKIEIRYFINSLPSGNEQFSNAVPKHCGIQTTWHLSLDVTYGENGLGTRSDSPAF